MTLKLDRFMSPDSPILIRIAQAIELKDIGTPEVERSIEKMLAVAYDEQKEREKPMLVGLAAPQIGISNRISAYTRSGAVVEEEHSDYTARIFQHSIMLCCVLYKQ